MGFIIDRNNISITYQSNGAAFLCLGNDVLSFAYLNAVSAFVADIYGRGTDSYVARTNLLNQVVSVAGILASLLSRLYGAL